MFDRVGTDHLEPDGDHWSEQSGTDSWRFLGISDGNWHPDDRVALGIIGLVEAGLISFDQRLPE